jgi:hypothetical protein
VDSVDSSTCKMNRFGKQVIWRRTDEVNHRANVDVPSMKRKTLPVPNSCPLRYSSRWIDLQ